MRLHPLSTLLRLARAVLYALPPLQTPTAGPAGSEAIHGKPVGFDQVTGMDRRPAAYSRRAYASRSWERPGQQWRWDGGKLLMKTVETRHPASSLIVVVAPNAPATVDVKRQAWNALAPIAARRRTPYSRLFEGSRP